MQLLSIVVPCYNEQESVSLYYDATEKVLKEMDLDYEVIFVNDGSKDNTIQELKKLQALKLMSIFSFKNSPFFL